MSGKIVTVTLNAEKCREMISTLTEYPQNISSSEQMILDRLLKALPVLESNPEIEAKMELHTR